MQRVIGAILVVASTGAAGILYGAWLKEYLETLLYLRHVVSILKGELEYTGAPMQEIFGRTAARVRQPYRNWLRGMEKRIDEREAESFRQIWNHAADADLVSVHLKREHLAQLKELGECLGQADRASEARNFVRYLERLEQEIEKERLQMAAKRRIGNCLGVMGGIFLVIVLL